MPIWMPLKTLVIRMGRVSSNSYPRLGARCQRETLAPCNDSCNIASFVAVTKESKNRSLIYEDQRTRQGRRLDGR